MSDKTNAPERKPGPVLLSSSPHINSPVSSAMIMGNMLIALAPAAVFGVVIFGLPALLTIVVSMAAAIAAEALFRLAIRAPLRIGDLSAGVTGLLLALVIPPTTPLWMTALGAVFAVVVAKEFFGGLGANVFNPALIGRGFLIMSFPAAMTSWRVPVVPPVNSFTADVVSGATPLGIIAEGGTIADVGASLAVAGLSTPIGQSGAQSYWPMIKALFLGHRGGSIGETSIVLILCAGIFLIITKTIDWRAPVSMIVSGFLCAWALGLDPLFHVLCGGLIFGAVFMATDYVTAPITSKGKIIFGIGAGIITMLIRKFGMYPEGVCFSILIMNAVTPFLNKLLPRKYGWHKEART
jgi:electron transport complex protein RnfD